MAPKRPRGDEIKPTRAKRSRVQDDGKISDNKTPDPEKSVPESSTGVSSFGPNLLKICFWNLNGMEIYYQMI